MPFRATFSCLWCGTTHAVRGPDDLEGWAQLCPACLGRAGDNEFLRLRLRTALADRAAATPTAPLPEDRAAGSGDASDLDDWYLRRGRHSRGPVHDLAWQVDLDAATVWLDGLPLAGEIVELAAGTGWWSPLLAQKGRLSIYDAAEEPLELARERLLAHGLRAHLHVRDAWAEPDREIDGLFTGFWLGRVPRPRLDEFLRLARRWLGPGGTFAFIDSRPDSQSGSVDLPVELEPVELEPVELEAALVDAGFRSAAVTTTSRFFLLGRAEA
jgi:SAM-dependent methyltransferase